MKPGATGRSPLQAVAHEARARWFTRAVCCALLALTASAARAQTQPDQPTATPTEEHKDGRHIFQFLGGAALGFAAHESGHLSMDLALGSDPYFKSVSGGGIPFFAISYRNPQSPRGQYAIAAAGFWVQHGMSEWILTRSPDLRHKTAPVAKGVLAFHVACSLIYTAGALGNTGPGERDTLGMAKAQRINERWVGLAVLTPAALDTYRYLHPRSRWAPWASRAAKLALLLAVLR
jgi:hypothetical protein